MPYCPFCGSEVLENDAFCRSCGAILNGTNASKPPKKNNTPKVIAVIIVFLVIVGSMAGIAAALTHNTLLSDELTRTYNWTYEGEKYSYSLTVERAYYNKMMDSDINRSGTVSEGRYVIDGKTTFAVKDYVVVDKYITQVSSDLTAMYKEKLGSDPTNDEYVNFVAAFVQICISYDDEEADSGSEYWRYPLETLFDGTGDCEDTSILLAALIDAKGLQGGVILAPGHAMCAIAFSEVTGSYDNKTHNPIAYDPPCEYFYPIETTYEDRYEPIGEIGIAYTTVYLHLYLGHETGYYFSS